MQGADALLLIIGAGHHSALSAKVFDYLQARRPIFGVGPADCAAADLVRRSGTGMWAETVEEIVAGLSMIATQGLPYAPIENEIKPYSADAMAEKTADLLNYALMSTSSKVDGKKS